MSPHVTLHQRRRCASTSILAQLTVLALTGPVQTAVAQAPAPIVSAPVSPALDERTYLVSASPQPTNLPAFNKSATRDASGADETLTRIVGGYAAPSGKWPSMVALYIRLPNRQPQFFCGGTVIDAEWILTAAHCLSHVDKTTGRMSILPADALMVREGTINLDVGGRAVNARSITIHKDYRPGLNDIALIQLAAPVEAPRQQLISNAAVSKLITQGRMATTMGFGLVQPLKANTTKEDQSTVPRSQQLLQVDVPIVGQTKCATTYKERVATGATFCAGRDEGGADTCPGDSGGPLFVRDDVGQALQAGVVSWGYGCAQPMLWGIYASVGHFEDWIKSHVPNASFGGASATAAPGQPATTALQSSPQPTAPTGPAPPNSTQAALQTMGASQTATAPSQSGHVTVDIVQGEQIRLGALITVRVTSSIAGRLILFSRDASDKTVLLFPNGRSDGSRPGQSNRSIKAGGSARVPQVPADGFVFQATEPGRTQLIAVVVPPGVNIDDLIKPGEGPRVLTDAVGVIGSLSMRMRDLSIVDNAPPNYAIGQRTFEVVP
jgi:secreted trypsin-like serine protease